MLEEQQLVISCGLGNMSHFLNIYNKIEIKNPVCIIDCFKNVSKHGNSKIASFLFEKWNFLIDTDIMYDCFLLSCINNHIKFSKYIYIKYSEFLIIDFNDNEIFRNCCKRGLVVMAYWLFSIYPQMNIYSMDYLSLRISAFNKHINTVKWLYSLNSNVPERIFNEMFLSACKHENLIIIEWILSVKPKFNIFFNNNECFHLAVENKKYKILNFYKTKYPHKFVLNIKNYYIRNDEEELENKHYSTILLSDEFLTNETNIFNYKKIPTNVMNLILDYI
jgi:hypothetical protein